MTDAAIPPGDRAATLAAPLASEAGSPAGYSDEPSTDDEPPFPDARADRSAQLSAAGYVVAALTVLGAVLGVVWEAWSPPGPLGIVLSHGVQADESESFVAGDGRFALLTVVVGLVAGVAAWHLHRVRGPYLALALAVGGVAGAALTELVGWALRGDRDDAKVGTVIRHLPLTVHLHALWFVEAAAAVLVYALFTAFAVSDDLGRPDHARKAGAGEPSSTVRGEPSVGAQHGTQDGRRDGDATGPA